MGVHMGMDRTTGDFMGMLATIMNALAVSNSLTQNNVKNVVLTSIELKGIADAFNQNKAIEALEEGKVVIFGGGTGHPYFSTDTTSALRALETKCEIILAAKNGVDGVYSADPRVDKNAVKYDEVSIQEVIDKNLQVVDITASILARDNEMEMYVFSLNEENSIVNTVKGQFKGTKVLV